MALDNKVDQKPFATDDIHGLIWQFPPLPFSVRRVCFWCLYRNHRYRPHIPPFILSSSLSWREGDDEKSQGCSNMMSLLTQERPI